MAKISKDFTWAEFEKSDVAKAHHFINAVTDWEVRDNIIALVENILQPLRDAYGKPIQINSGYRNPELNSLVGGVATSQHCKGQAADCGVDNPYALAKLAKNLDLDYDQMILYPNFVHFSYRRDGKNRNQLLYNKRYKGTKDI